MANKFDKIVSKYGKYFDKQRKKLLPVGTRYILLKNTGRTGSFTRLLEIDKCIHSYNDWLEKTHVKVGRNDSEFINALFEASDIAIGSTQLLVYAIDVQDFQPPDIDNPWWDFYCSISGGVYKYES